MLQQVGTALLQLFPDARELEVDVTDRLETAAEATDAAVVEREHRTPGCSGVFDVAFDRGAGGKALLQLLQTGRMALVELGFIAVGVVTLDERGVQAWLAHR